MDEKTQKLLDRTFRFSVHCLRFLAEVPKDDINRVLIYQLAKSSTSIGANYEEAQAAESRADFAHKVGVSLKEARECHYWFRLFHEISNNFVNHEQLITLINEASELKKIFGKIRYSTRKENLSNDTYPFHLFPLSI